MEQLPHPENQELPERYPLHINLAEEGRSIFMVISSAEHLLANKLFDELDTISNQMIRGEEVSWDRFHQAATNFALLKKDIIDTVGSDSLSMHHDDVLAAINRHIELVDVSGMYTEYRDVRDSETQL